MFSPLLTLVADAYPLIWPPPSVAAEPHGIRHWLVPGCWFSITIGLLCAMAGGSPSPIPPAATKTDQMTPACLGCHIIFLLSTPAKTSRRSGRFGPGPDSI